MSRRFLFVVNAEWYFLSHRLALARAVRDNGWDVTVAARVERGYRSAIESEGFRFIPLRLVRNSVAPHIQIAEVWELYQIYRRERPNVVHHITIKPVIYGSIAARAARVPAIVNTIPGLGFMFSGSGLLGWIRRQTATVAYRIALSGEKTWVILQNADDLALFVTGNIVPTQRTCLIRGSGVDVGLYAPTPEPSGIPIVVLASRLLWDKGVGELIEAARILQTRGVSCRIALVGAPDPGNPNSVSKSLIEQWQSEGIVEWWGMRNDMPTVLQAASIVALPSYREGIPRILLEAAAAGRPIISTDAPGCREVVRNGENGILVPVRDAHAIADAITLLVGNPGLRAQMGARGREIALAEFSESRIVAQTLDVYRRVSSGL